MNNYIEYSVEDVSRCVVESSFSHDLSISNLRLQKLLYFLQGFRLVDSDGTVGLFKENIVAWKFGPVVKESYFLFNKYGRSPITDYSSVSKIEFNDGKVTILHSQWVNPLKDRDKDFVSKVILGLKNFKDSRLVSITHDEDGPWARNFDLDESNIIPSKEIYEYFLQKTRKK